MKRIAIFTFLIFIIFVSFIIYKNKSIVLEKFFDNEKKIDISLCGETYNVVDVNINGRYITKDLISATSKKGDSWCNNLKAISGENNSLQVKYNGKYPKDITIIYRAIRYEYVVKLDGIYLVDQYAGGLGPKILELK